MTEAKALGQADSNWLTAEHGTLTRDDWAWESLRRNRVYANMAARRPVLRRLADGIDVIETTDTGQAAQWGLLFCRVARASRPHYQRLLAGQGQSRRTDRYDPRLSGRSRRRI